MKYRAIILLMLVAAQCRSDEIIDCKNIKEIDKTYDEIRICNRQEYDEVDLLLNNKYKEVIARFNERIKSPSKEYSSQYYESGKSKLISAQREWIKFRDLHCLSFEDAVLYGTAQESTVNICMTKLTRERIIQLEEYKAVWTENE